MYWEQTWHHTDEVRFLDDMAVAGKFDIIAGWLIAALMYPRDWGLIQKVECIDHARRLLAQRRAA